MKEILRNQDKMYALLEDDVGCLVLSAMCGGVGMYEVKVQLTSDEIERYNDGGENYIAELAHAISTNTSKYNDRLVN
jgi:hypothetical protein